jgi:transcriptional regulator with XRE-family HTH domain
MIGKRIRQIRKLRGLTQKSFAESLYISQNFLSEVESGKANPSTTLLALIEYRYKISKEWLMTGKGSIQAPGEEAGITSPELKIITPKEAKEHLKKSDRLDNFIPVPLLSDNAAAGQPAYINENDIEGYAIIYRSWVKDEKLHTAIRIRGDSMSPVLEQGFIVGLDHSQRDPKKLQGKMVAARCEEGRRPQPHHRQGSLVVGNPKIELSLKNQYVKK